MDLNLLKRQNLESLLNAYDYPDQSRRTLSILERNPPEDPKRALSWALRHHSSGAVRSPIEIAFRSSIDSLLNTCSLLEVASQVGFIDLRSSGKEAIAHDLLLLLDHPDVETFYRQHYRLLLPRLLRARLADEPIRTPLEPQGTALFLDFLSLDARFRRNHEQGVLLKLLDDYTLSGVRFYDVRDALGDSSRIVAIMLENEEPDPAAEVLRAAVREFPLLIVFCVQLAELLSRVAAWPTLQSAFWHYYSYWFALIRESINEKLSSGITALQSCLEQAAVDQEPGNRQTREEARCSIEISLKAVGRLTSREFDAPIRRFVEEIDRYAQEQNTESSARGRAAAPEILLEYEVRSSSLEALNQELDTIWKTETSRPETLRPFGLSPSDVPSEVPFKFVTPSAQFDFTATIVGLQVGAIARTVGRDIMLALWRKLIVPRLRARFGSGLRERIRIR